MVYTVNEQSNTITVHLFDSDLGTLRIIQDVSTLPAGYPDQSFTASLRVHPNGKWIYASNRGHDSIAGFAIAADGTLRPPFHVSAPSSPRSFDIDPGGRFLYCAGEASGTMNSYGIDQTTGTLHPLAHYDVGKRPFWVLATSLAGP